ncbi:MAG TPA: hypothetical protein VFL17_20680 [Anaerolineae bacterium]|nr:hypothetical protein [Anaerolineae bacterium]
MPLKPLEPIDLLSRLEFKKPSQGLDSVRARSIELLKQGKLLEAADHAREALRDGTERHDRNMQVYAFAYLAAVYTIRKDFREATAHADDCYGLSKQMRNQHNTAIAKALLAMVYQKHLEELSGEFIEPIREVQAEFDSLTSQALAHGQVAEAQKNQASLIEFGEQARRVRWIPALPYTLPLVWLRALDPIKTDPPHQGYLEPVMFVLRMQQEVEREESGNVEPGEIVDALYTARPVPNPNSPDAHPLRPPRLDPHTVYIAVKVDPDMAREPGYQVDDYLLLRGDDPNQLIRQVEEAKGDLTGMEFRRTDDGRFQFRFAPPKDTGGREVSMLMLTVDAILRRIPHD